MPERLRVNQCVSILVMLITLCVTPQWSLSNTVTTPSAPEQFTDDRPIFVVLGLANSLNDDIKRTIATEFVDRNLSVIELDDQSLRSIEWPEQGLIIAAGVAGCEQILGINVTLDVRCVLLTEENFRSIHRNAKLPLPRSLSALVIDQPVVRQAQVAQRVYPALSRFAVLSESNKQNDTASSKEISLDSNQYRPTLPLAPQLSEVLATNDALIAIPESSIFSRKTLRTVLLTAYGYGKPVVGLSRAYVKAGALITAYSTPEQIFREIAETPTTAITESATIVSYPRYFSIADNVNVAKSLRLTKLLSFDAYTTFTDRDFRP
ncbi:MAG: hypothetical protein AB8B87_00660 [Granulosicoccus sp.]